jgi:2-amino-4-hydroxy-6-hydroxymethyldihydropteridine diphosphokinase
MSMAYIGIGSNMGDPRGNCLDALDRIGKIEGCEIISVSSLYLTEPVGVDAQEWYVNGAVSISTKLTARDLMNHLLAIEADMGRVRTLKWGPRVIDLDVLLFGREIIDDIIVTVPHPLMHLRRFVMAPMADLAPDLIHPVLKRTIMELFREIPENDQVITRLEGI